jgi:phosphatidylserine decarboxylase
MKHPAVLIQNLLPQPHMARAFGRLARSRQPWLRRLMIFIWMRTFNVSLAEARRTDPEDYGSFEDFFTRELREGARPQPEDANQLSAPADGHLQHFGAIDGDTLIQAKGIDYPLGRLLGDDKLASRFHDGWYITIYLTPGDYHRVHAPADATLRASTTIPGQAYSVTEATRQQLQNLYCRNERLVSVFESRAGPMALVMIGAMLVTGIETVWRPHRPIDRLQTDYLSRSFLRGEELGRFTLGSTVILVLPADFLRPATNLEVGQQIRIGQPLGAVRQHASKMQRHTPAL